MKISERKERRSWNNESTQHTASIRLLGLDMAWMGVELLASNSPSLSLGRGRREEKRESREREREEKR
jgi:hypothetical protein